MTRALIAMSLVFAVSTAAPAQDVFVGFDAVSAPGPFAFIVPGFANGPLVEHPEVTLDGAVILLDVLFGNSATSGGNIYATCDTCLLGDGPPATGLPGMLWGTFPDVVDAITLDAINGSTAGGGTITLTAFDAGGAAIASDSAFTPSMSTPGFVQELSVAAPGIRSFEVTAALPSGYSFAIDSLRFHRTEGVWADLGQALAGAAGEPQLLGSGVLQAGEPIALELTGAAPGGPTALVVGLSQAAVPFKGGVLVPSPDVVLAGLPVTAGGELSLASGWPPGVPSGTTLTFQHWIVDAAGPKGFAASNAVSGTTP